MSDAAVRIRIDFGPERALGPGKVALLEGIQRTGSLAETAREMGMAYRRAWLLLQSINELCDEPLTLASTGGRGGGGVTLTRRGEALIAAYRQLETDVSRRVARDFKAFAGPGTKRSAASAPVKPVSRATTRRDARPLGK